jgi:hypothetical protein
VPSREIHPPSSVAEMKLNARVVDRGDLIRERVVEGKACRAGKAGGSEIEVRSIRRIDETRAQ